MNLCASTWSLHRLIPDEIPLFQFPFTCSKLGVPAVEIVENHLLSRGKDYLEKLKNSLVMTNSSLVCLAVNNDFTRKNKGILRKEIDHVKESLEIAAFLGAKVIRINTGTEDKSEEAISRVIEVFKELLPAAEKLNLTMALENHGGISASSDNIVKIIKEANSEFFGSCPDFGNFPQETRYEDLKKVSSFAFHVHAKSYEFDNAGNETAIDYEECIKIFHDAGYDGYLSVEFEGKGDQMEGLKKTIELIRRYIY